MTLKEAKKIKEIHDWHTQKRKEAKIAGDEKTAEHHQNCLTLMQDLYDKASKVISWHQ